MSSNDFASYTPRQVEADAQQFWEQTKAYEVIETSTKPKFYCLSMFMYPSGSMHMGHVRNYTIGDVISRFKWMTGHNVLQPMGWDAFGLPAENAAIANRTKPAAWTYQNIAHMRRQLRSLGYAIDWSRELTTCQPEYYVHEQQLFTRLMRKGMAYRQNAVVNWDPVDQTVLANEQVIDGRGWRSGALVEKREIPQWFLRITEDAQELLDGLDLLNGWPDSVKIMQRNWIARSEGLEIQFDILDQNGRPLEPIRIFTTRPDTVMGVTFLSIAAEHPLAILAGQHQPELATFLDELRRGSVSEVATETQEKRGMPTGLRALHPITGEKLPIWVANFVLMSYGTGAVMAVPGHDQRDFEFAHKYQLPIRQVLALTNASADDPPWERETWHDWYGDSSRASELIHSEEFDGLNPQDAFAILAERFERQGRGQRRVNYRLRDWGVSRQRYWGCPIPVIYCEQCGAIPVPDDQLPVVLPEDVEFSGTQSPLKTDVNWRRTTCPHCGRPAERETDTFDTFMESSWYYARYTSPDAPEIIDKAKGNYWLPVDQYVGGIEHAILHLMYFRFFHKMLRDARLVESDEPATHLLTQGMVVAETFYQHKTDGGIAWVHPSAIVCERDTSGRVREARLRDSGEPVMSGGIQKMSKSKNNGVDPQAMVDKYGADTVRLFTMFAAPPEQTLEWNEAGVEGMARFLRRLWNLVHRHGALGAVVGEPVALTDRQRALRCKIHHTIRKVRDDYGRRYGFNTAISAIMELSNQANKMTDMTGQGRVVLQEALESIILLLNPITPHICHRLWQVLGHHPQVLENVPFPSVDEAALEQPMITIGVQVNGKLRTTLDVPAQASREQIEAMMQQTPAVRRYLQAQPVRRLVIVPGKIINIVTG